VGVLGALAIVMAGCGIRVSPTTSTLHQVQKPTASPTIQDSTTSSSSPTSGTATPTTFPPGSAGATTMTTTTSGSESTTNQIESDYHTFLVDLSGLDDNLNSSWSSALQTVATARLVLATQRDAAAIAQAHEHGVGMLMVDHEVVKAINASQATVFGCLDEYDFYLVQNANGQPDPAVSRGDFIGVADMVLVNGQWKVDVWESEQGHCTYSSK
jgi:hypothetical protein